MIRKERLEILEKELVRQQEWYKVCQANNSTINYSTEDYARESMLKRKIQETKDWIKTQNQKTRNDEKD